MNIIIPLGGKGERFTKNGYVQPKPLIPIFDKCMIDYVFDNLHMSKCDNVFIIYNGNLDNYGFSAHILRKYPFITVIQIADTKGAVETLYLGLDYILNNHEHNQKCLILDCDTFYTEDIVSIFKESSENIVFYTNNREPDPIYSYIELDDDSSILNIKEKEKISDNANTGAYAFNDINTLFEYCRHVVDNDITFNNEPYTSCVISEMIKSKIAFKGFELQESRVFSLGTPLAIDKYVSQTYAFMFDLDGTLVITDDIYYDVWYEILLKYNIILTKDIFTKYIQGNNDKFVLRTLLMNIELSITDLAELKNALFIENIHKLKIVDGIYDIISQIKNGGHKVCIVTNSNTNTANEIIKHICVDASVDFVITNNDCKIGKPNGEPYELAMKKYNIGANQCFIFEDSKTGILSGKSVNPRMLVGIETIYSKMELLNYGVDISIADFVNVDINTLIYSKNDNIMSIVNKIKRGSSISNIKQITVNECKLKGGFIADVIGFTITTTDDIVYPLILKYEKYEQNNLSIMANKLDLYNREYYFYTHISKNITNIKIPIYYNLIINDENGKLCGLVLENLEHKQYKINLNLNQQTIDITLKIVDRMARLHSSFWNKDLKSMFPELKTSLDAAFCPFFTEFISERYEVFKSKWFKILTPIQIERCDIIYADFANIQSRFSNGNHLTFIHGDIKSPNIFYDVEHGYEPYFIDWQHCAIGKGVQDLIFFVIESFDIVDIKSIFNLVKIYYYKKITEYGIVNYTLENYDRDIYDALCYIPFFTSIWFGTVPQDELIDKNFPYFLISKLFYLIEFVYTIGSNS